MRSSNEFTIKEALEAYIKKFDRFGKFERAAIVNAWEHEMGPIIKKHTKSIYVKGDKLFVYLSSPAIKNELLMARSKIVKSLNERVGQDVITEIIIR